MYDKSTKMVGDRYNLKGKNGNYTTYIYSSAPNSIYDKNAETLNVVLGNRYALVKAPITEAGIESFASKPRVVNLPKQKKAPKYEYIPLTESVRNVRDGKAMYYIGDPSTTNKSWEIFDRNNEATKTASEHAVSPNDVGGDTKEVYFRAMNSSGRTPPGAISQKIVIPARTAPPAPIFGSSKPSGNELVIDTENELVKTAEAGQMAYYKAGTGKKIRWRVMKKKETPLRMFIPRSGEAVVQFIQAGTATSTVSNSEPISVTFVARPENPTENDISYNYGTKQYTASDLDLLVSPNGKSWTRLKANETYNAAHLKKPIYYRIAPSLGPSDGTKAPVPASAKAVRFKFENINGEPNE